MSSESMVVILNPKSGDGSGPSALKRLEDEAGVHGKTLEVLVTDKEGDAEVIKIGPMKAERRYYY